MGRINKNIIEEKIVDLISENTTLCTDAWKSYGTFTLEKNLDHYKHNASEGRYVIKRIYHIQNVNSFHSNLKNWIKRFKGVSSKYLNNYLAWFKYVENKRFSTAKSDRKDILFDACHYKVRETYKSFRLTKFNLVSA